MKSFRPTLDRLDSRLLLSDIQPTASPDVKVDFGIFFQIDLDFKYVNVVDPPPPINKVWTMLNNSTPNEILNPPDIKY